MAQRVDEARPLDATRTELTERSRDRILAAALEEFANRGFDGTTTAEIARRAGVTQPLVHYHFESKDVLWKAAVGAAFAGIFDVFDGVTSELTDLAPVDQMKVLVRRYVHFSATYPECGRIIFFEGVQGGPRLDWLIEHQLAGQFEWLRTILEQAIEDGTVKPLPVEHVLTSLGAAGAYLFVVRAAMRDMHGIDVADPAVVEAHADTVVEMFFHGIVADASVDSGGAR